MPSNISKAENILVAMRCRPVIGYGNATTAHCCVTCSRDQVSVRDRHDVKYFKFDHIFDSNSNQCDLFQTMIVPMIRNFIQGYNCTIFAYGQTGSGKTFTMTGDSFDAHTTGSGIIPRSLDYIFRCLKQKGTDFSIRLSCLDIFNEELSDVLSVNDTARLIIYDDVHKKGDVIVKGLREVVVVNLEDARAILERGTSKHRTNVAQSSRSHSVWTVTLHSRETKHVSGEEVLRISKLHLVDLGGTECIGRSGAVEKHAREAGSVNQSLLTFNRVITALVQNSSHVPYRESKLTRLLQDSLGGKSKTCIIATVNPSASCVDDTLNTLEYACKARQIENRPELNERLSRKDFVRTYNEELERLHRDLEANLTQTGVYMDKENYDQMHVELKEQQVTICSLDERRDLLEQQLFELQNLFSSCQHELNEVTKKQEETEDTVARYQDQLESVRVKLLKQKAKLDEETHICVQYKRNNEVLSSQATSLLSTARSAITDVHGLHEKIDRLMQLDDHNQASLAHLTRWVTQHVSEPLQKISEIERSVRHSCAQFETSVADLRICAEDNVSSICKNQKLLKDQLANQLATNLSLMDKELNKFANDQSELSETYFSQLIRPQSLNLARSNKQLTSHISQLADLLSTHYDKIRASDKLYLAFEQHLLDLMRQSEEFAKNQTARYEELRNAWMKHCQPQSSALRALKEECNRTRRYISDYMSLDMQRVEEFHRVAVKQFAEIEEQLLHVHQQGSNHHNHFDDTSKDCLQRLNTDLSGVTLTHNELRTEVDNCLHRITSKISECRDHGLGQQLRQESSGWMAEDSENVDPSHQSVRLHCLTHMTADRLAVWSVDQSERILKLTDSNKSLETEAAQSLDEIKENLSTLPKILDEKLTSDMHPYKPTGQTPQQKQFSCPSTLAKTRPLQMLRRAFREKHNEQSLNQITLTPLPASNDRDSFLTEPDMDQSDSDLSHPQPVEGTPLRSAIAQTSDLGSERSFTDIVMSEIIPAHPEVIGRPSAGTLNKPVE